MSEKKPKIGAPRTVTPPDKELHKIGKELVDWACSKDDDELKCHLKQWWSVKKGYTKNQWDAMCETECFFPYYKRAKDAISIRYLNGGVNASIAHRFMWHYFPEAEKQDKDKAKYESDLKKDALVDFDGKLGKVLDYLKDKSD
jgi:hypothetical protein